MSIKTLEPNHILHFRVYVDNYGAKRLVAREMRKFAVYDNINRVRVSPYTYMDTGEEFWIEETSIHRYPKLTYDQAVNLFPEDFV